MTRRFSAARARRWFEGYLLLLPFLILFALFIIWPILQSLYLSFTKFNGIRAPVFIGLENFETLLGEARFHKALRNTSIYVILAVFISNSLGLCLALAFRSNSWLNYVMRTMLFLPSVTSSIAIAVLWRWIFSGESYGLLNALRKTFGLEAISFLSTPSLAIPVLVTLAVWGGMGYSMVLFLAGLNAVPGELNEAAAIDGANVSQRFWNVTFPLLRPTLLYVVITGIIGAFQTFDSVYLLFGSTEGVGGVLDSALFVVPYLYEQGFTFFKLGLASAIAWVLFVIIFIITLINLVVGRANRAD